MTKHNSTVNEYSLWAVLILMALIGVACIVGILI